MDLVVSAAGAGQKNVVFKRLEQLELLVASRADLVASLAKRREEHLSSVVRYRAVKGQFETLARQPDEDKRRRAAFVEATETPSDLLRTAGLAPGVEGGGGGAAAGGPSPKKPFTSPATDRNRFFDDMWLLDDEHQGGSAKQAHEQRPEWPVVDATNLCMVFKAFQPFLDRNVPDATAEECLASVLHPQGSPGVYRLFAPHTRKNGTVVRWKGRHRRRHLVILQQAEEMENGGVPDAKVRVTGWDGALSPTPFMQVLWRLTEGRVDRLLVKVLFEWFETQNNGSSGSATVELGSFLDTVDDVVEDNRLDVAAMCFNFVCARDSNVLTKAHLYGEVAAQRRLSPGQISCLLDHFPPGQQLPKLPDLPHVRKNERKRRQLEAEVSAVKVQHYRVGPTMSRRQFEAAFEESPFLFVCFLDLVLRFTANELSKPNWNQGRHTKSSLQLLGPVWLAAPPYNACLRTSPSPSR